MTYQDFVLFYENIVYPYYEELKQLDSEYKSLSIQKWKMRFVYYKYESNRKNIRKLYMANESDPMDRHKIAANMMCSLLNIKPFKVNRIKANLSLPVLLANEYIALYCALNIVELYKSDKLGYDYKLIIPETFIKGEGKLSFVENTCKALYYSKHFRLNDIFSYANILFLLEKYTDTVLGIMKPPQKESKGLSC